MPKVVEIFPSIPARPRFAKTVRPDLGIAKASTSLIGLDEPINSALPVGIWWTMEDTATDSLQELFFAISASAIVQTLFQSEIQLGFKLSNSTSGISKKVSVAVLALSIF